MNPHYREYKFPFVKSTPLHRVLQGAPAEGVDFIASLLQYSPNARPKAMQALMHPFFDELRNQETRQPSGLPLQDLFNWTEEEKRAAGPIIIERLTPNWYRIPELL